MISWGDVAFSDRNGIITDYIVTLMKTSTGAWISTDLLPQGQHSYAKTGLKYWTVYDVIVSARTSVGQGPSSNPIQIRTDEDSKLLIWRNLKYK